MLVVGASASGLQIARELAAAGRRGDAGGRQPPAPAAALPRRRHPPVDGPHRRLDAGLRQGAELDAAAPPAVAAARRRHRRTPTSTSTRCRTAASRSSGGCRRSSGGIAWFSGALANACASADLKLRRLLDRIDAHAEAEGLDAGRPYRLSATRVPDAPRLSCRLREDGIGTVVWATGYEPDHAWVRLPVFDAKGHIRHDGGVVGDGLYVMGLRYLRTARSSHISGAGARRRSARRPPGRRPRPAGGSLRRARR